VLQAAGALALVVWVGSATLFYCFENQNPRLVLVGGGYVFSSIPQAVTVLKANSSAQL
jgi:hypothetical protein